MGVGSYTAGVFSGVILMGVLWGQLPIEKASMRDVNSDGYQDVCVYSKNNWEKAILYGAPSGEYFSIDRLVEDVVERTKREFEDSPLKEKVGE